MTAAHISAVVYITSQRGASPVRSLNVIRRGHLFDSQHVVERLTSGGQGALPLLLSHDASRPQTAQGNTKLKKLSTPLGLHVTIHEQTYTIRNKGSKGVLPEGLIVYPEPAASLLEERVCQGFFVRLRAPLRTLFIQRTLFEQKSS